MTSFLLLHSTLSLSTRGSIYCQTDSPPSNYYIGGSTCMTSMYRVALYIARSCYVCVHQQVGQSNRMTEHTQSLISATYFP